MDLSTGSQTVYFDEGAALKLGPLLDSLQARRILFVVDRAAYSAAMAARQLRDVLSAYETAYFDEFEINPRIQDIERGLQRFADHAPDVVLALGGGTALDLGKMIRGLAGQRRALEEIVSSRSTFDPNPIPLVVMPTTSGTGSESTHFAVVYRNGEKHSIAHSGLMPNCVILDPTLTYSMPPSITAATGLDALCQAVESIWAVGATDESVQYASHSLRLAIANLEAAVHSPTPASRRAMCEAAHFAGKAINISKTTASHAISYYLTTRYGIPHGIAVAVTLPRMLEYNAHVHPDDCADPRGPRHVQSRIDKILSILNVDDVIAGRQKLEQLFSAIHCPVTLRDLDIASDAEISELARQTNVERLSNNPRRFGADQLAQLLTKSERDWQIAEPSPTVKRTHLARQNPVRDFH
jgi:alcohol dehydrogenase class IV